MNRAPHLLVLGLGYSARAVAELAIEAGFQVTGTSRDGGADAPAGVTTLPPDQAETVFERATHWLASAPPGEDGDPFIGRFDRAMRGARPDWIGYFSTTGLYGDHKGGWVDETTEPRPVAPRGRRRLDAERAWQAVAEANGARLDLLRLAGIYGPGRNVFAALRDGTSRRIVAPGHQFGRIHRDDIAGATLAAMRSGPARRVLNLVDDLPAESAEVITFAAALLGIAPPPELPLDQALATMSPMGRSFWAENRKVSGAATRQALDRPWRYPTYREGLAAILAGEKHPASP